MMKWMICAAFFAAVMATAQVNAQEPQKEQSKTEQCCKAEGKACKKEGKQCCKAEGKACKKEGKQSPTE